MREKIILKSVNPEQYGDLEIDCRVISNDQIGNYLANISDERKFVAYKTGAVLARKGIPGEIVKTILTTVVDGRTYILSEEEGVVKERTYTTRDMSTGTEHSVIEPDYVITNISSTSNEQYITKAERIGKTYDFVQSTGEGLLLLPKYDPRVLTQVDENVIIVTAWGSKAVCLKGSYIVTYDALENDYNTLEQGAFVSTYTVEKVQDKKLVRK